MWSTGTVVALNECPPRTKVNDANEWRLVVDSKYVPEDYGVMPELAAIITVIQDPDSEGIMFRSRVEGRARSSIGGAPGSDDLLHTHDAAPQSIALVMGSLQVGTKGFDRAFSSAPSTKLVSHSGTPAPREMWQAKCFACEAGSYESAAKAYLGQESSCDGSDSISRCRREAARIKGIHICAATSLILERNCACRWDFVVIWTVRRD